jgi:hypothetical protein
MTTALGAASSPYAAQYSGALVDVVVPSARGAGMGRGMCGE